MIPLEPGTSLGPSQEEPTPRGVIVPLDILPNDTRARPFAVAPAPLPNRPYSPEKQRDYVRLIVTCGLLLILGYLVVWATIESASWPAHWAQTKEMLQIILPAVIGIIGTVIGFYFGTAAVANNNQPPGDDAS